MCGIAALINLNQSSNDLHYINLMTDVITHRGPDDEGFAFFARDDQSPENQPYTAHIFSGKDSSPKFSTSLKISTPHFLTIHLP